MKRIIAVILSAVLFAAVLPFSAYAAPDEGTKYFELPILEEEFWEKGEGILQISKRRASGKNMIYASAEKDADKLSVSAVFDPLDLSEYSELSFDVSVKGSGDIYDVAVTLSSNDASATHEVTVDSHNTVFYLPLDTSFADSFSAVTVEVDAPGGEVSYITVSSLVADDTYTYSYLSSFASTDVVSDNPLVKTENQISIVPKNNSATISPLFSAAVEEGRSALVWIDLEKPASGTLSAIAKYTLEEDKEETYTCIPLSATSSGAYTFVVPGGYDSVSFEFFSLQDNSPISIAGAGYADMGETVQNLGTVTSCSYNGKSLTVSGSLSTDASLKYIDSKILLYRIPAYSVGSFKMDDLKNMKPVAQSSFSTRFSLSFNCDSSYATWFYMVVLDTDDGYLSVGDIHSANCGFAASSSTGSLSAFLGTDDACVFDSNVGNTVIDVCASKLLEVENIYSAEAYNYSGQYYFNREYLTSIDNSLRFFDAAGINVYLRVFSDKDGYLFDYSPDDRESLSLMCAVASFLAERYESVSGFIMGAYLNSAENNTPEACEKKARLVSIFTECIKSKSPGTAVFLPFSESGESDLWLTSSMLYYYMSKYGAPATATMYEFSEGIGTAPYVAGHIAAIGGQFGCLTEGSCVIWNAPATKTNGEISEEYGKLCISAKAYGSRFAALNVSKVENKAPLYSSLKKMMDTENISVSKINILSASAQKEEFTGTYPLWDFTTAYETKGWVSGGSFSSPVSAKGKYSSRALFSAIEENGAGILIARLNTPLDASDTSVRITLSISSKAAESAEISLIFGSQNARADFSATAKCGSVTTLVCDMKDFSGANSIEYAALIVKGVPDAEAELSMVELCSTKLTAEEIELKYSQEDTFEHHPILYAIVIFIAAGTVTVFSLLLKKKKTVKKENTDE